LSSEERVAILTPTARDGPLTVSLLARAGVKGLLARDGRDLLRLIEEGVESALVAEEALSSETSRELRTVLEHQEPWSDLPVIIFAASSDRTRARRTVESLAPHGNVVLLERPVSTRTLISSVRAALRARRRQYGARQLVEQLAGAVRARDEFLAMLGHELRNPLAAMLVASDLIQEKRDSARSQAIIARQVRKLSRLVDDLLEVSRVSSGKIPLQRAPVDLREVVRRSVEVLEYSPRRPGLQIALSLPEQEVLIDGDALRLEQVMGNLLSNAVKYTPDGGSITVEVGSRRTGRWCASGTPGSESRSTSRSRSSEPFAQVASSFHRSEGGLGRGLSLVRGLVALHGGRVQARSEGPNQGSEFVVELPAPGQLRLPPAPPSPEPPATPRRTVLVVDDQQDNREAVVMALEEFGHLVREAADGPTAVRVALEMVPDTEIVDIGLPGFDGYEVARRIRAALGEGPYLLAVTGYGQADAVERARRAGFDQHLTKPVELAALLRSLSASRPWIQPSPPP
jgi:signal transduction histidine kinase/ActR/RegA family two-component response regulator